MKKIIVVLLMLLMLTGCKTNRQIKLDSIVDIPLHPTQLQTQPSAEATQPLTEAAQAPTEAATEAAKTPVQHAVQSAGKDANESTAKDKDHPKATQPPETEPVTQPPAEPATEAVTDPPVYDPAGYIPGSLDQAVADAVNAQRQAAELPLLRLDSRLCAIASVRAREIAVNWSHTRPDGTEWQTVLTDYGYACSVQAENLYFGTGGAASIVSKWMSSEHHQANLLLADAASIGVASYKAADGLTYVAALVTG